mgnify:FL=1
MSYVVAVDGASGTGKGTVTRIVAEKLGLVTIDTGALYRCVTLEILDNNISFDDVEKIRNLTKNLKVDLKVENDKQLVFLNGKDVSVEIRTPRVTSNVSTVAAIKEVREEMTHIQRRLAEGKNVIMEGRDIGTTIFPNADVKIFLECSAEERAKRRVKQNAENGINTSYEEVLQSIKNRDKIDSTREVSPLRKAEDAIVVTTDGCKDNEGGEKVYQVVYETLKNKKII